MGRTRGRRLERVGKGRQVEGKGKMGGKRGGEFVVVRMLFIRGCCAHVLGGRDRRPSERAAIGGMNGLIPKASKRMLRCERRGGDKGV